MPKVIYISLVKFLSTLSLRRATRAPPYNLMIHHISIHALLAESDSASYNAYLEESISIHALLAESDVDEIPYQRQIDQFLSTLSLRRATGLPVAGRIAHRISIHALLAESDTIILRGFSRKELFLSTLSLRRATFSA